MTTATTQQLKQLNNTVEIVGLLKNKNLEVKQSTKDGVTKNYITGTLTVEVKDEAKQRVHNHTVRVYFTEGTKLYKGIETVNREYKDKDTFGEEFADLVKITGELEGNDYYNQAGELVSNNQIKGVFFKRLDQPTPHFANASVECVVENFLPEMGKDSIPTGNLGVNLFTIGYGNKVSVLQKVVIGPELADAFSNMYQPNSTGRLLFALNNYATVSEKVQAQPTHGFGAQNNISNTVTNWTNNVEIIGGDIPNVNGLTPEEIALAKQIRNLKLQEVKEKAQAPSTPPTPTGFGVPQTGFGLPTAPPVVPTLPTFAPTTPSVPTFAAPPTININADELPDF